ncbi:hypothetical protein KAI92_01320 [Candidatus Parcubacteria bacterium]|nr:hypothetical protein [Candidatus Parcubacteria bacterium]
MIIITRPEHDLTTKYISLWAEEIIKLADEKGIEVVDLKRNKAINREFVGRVKKLNPKVIFVNGHGNDICVAGHNNKPLIEKNVNHEILKGKITYALSCRSGKILGREVLQYRESAYIGYKDDFIIIMDKNYSFKPLEDPKAKLFMEASNQIMISLLKGHNVGEASKKSKGKFKSSYIKLLASNTDVGSLTIAQYLWWNERNQVCLGSDDMKI